MRHCRSLTVVITLLCSLQSRADTPTSEEVLKSHGLTLSGKVFIFDSESEFLEKCENVRPLYDELTEAEARIQEIANYDKDVRNYEHIRTEANANLQEARANLKDANGPRRPNSDQKAYLQQLKDMVNYCADQLAEAEKNLEHAKIEAPTQEFRQEAMAKLKTKRSTFVKAAKDLLPLSETVKKAYVEVGKDREAAEALKVLRSKKKYVLGPSEQFKKTVSVLNSVMGNPAPKSPDTSKPPAKKARKS